MLGHFHIISGEFDTYINSDDGIRLLYSEKNPSSLNECSTRFFMRAFAVDAIDWHEMAIRCDEKFSILIFVEYIN